MTTVPSPDQPLFEDEIKSRHPSPKSEQIPHVGDKVTITLEAEVIGVRSGSGGSADTGATGESAWPEIYTTYKVKHMGGKVEMTVLAAALASAAERAFAAYCALQLLDEDKDAPHGEAFYAGWDAVADENQAWLRGELLRFALYTSPVWDDENEDDVEAALALVDRFLSDAALDGTS